jgi:beta-1,4-N-acetylglucosaminyltransferase
LRKYRPRALVLLVVRHRPSKAKVALVGSSGGHLLHLLQLRDWYQAYPRVWATFGKPDAVHYLAGERVYWIHYPTNRNLLNLLRNTLVAWRLLWRERPTLIISSGAGGAIPFFFLGRLFGARLIWIEVIDRLFSATLTGRLVAPIADAVIVQWDSQRDLYRNAIVLGPVFE